MIWAYLRRILHQFWGLLTHPRTLCCGIECWTIDNPTMTHIMRRSILDFGWRKPLEARKVIAIGCTHGKVFHGQFPEDLRKSIWLKWGHYSDVRYSEYLCPPSEKRQ